MRNVVAKKQAFVMTIIPLLNCWYFAVHRDSNGRQHGKPINWYIVAETNKLIFDTYIFMTNHRRCVNKVNADNVHTLLGLFASLKYSKKNRSVCQTMDIRTEIRQYRWSRPCENMGTYYGIHVYCKKSLSIANCPTFLKSIYQCWPVVNTIVRKTSQCTFQSIALGANVKGIRKLYFYNKSNFTRDQWVTWYNVVSQT